LSAVNRATLICLNGSSIERATIGARRIGRGIDLRQFPDPHGVVFWYPNTGLGSSRMSFQRQISQRLDEEHRANLELLGRIEKALARNADAELPALAGPLVRHLEHEVGRHFGFEEEQLFPRMADSGDEDLATLLAEEHDSIRAVAEELLPLARAAASGSALAGADLATFKRLAIELTERQVGHIQKETMALLPLLDDLLDDEADRELAFVYSCD
jgi:hemerythrin-like domain-containing protein